MSQTIAHYREDVGTRAEGRGRNRVRLLRWVLMAGGVLVVLVGGLLYWLDTGAVVSTDDAYVEANVETVSTDVSGIVESIPVHEGQTVQKGQVLFRLDPQKFQYRPAERPGQPGGDQADAAVGEVRLPGSARLCRRQAGAGEGRRRHLPAAFHPGEDLRRDPAAGGRRDVQAGIRPAGGAGRPGAGQVHPGQAWRQRQRASGPDASLQAGPIPGR